MPRKNKKPPSALQLHKAAALALAKINVMRDPDAEKKGYAQRYSLRHPTLEYMYIIHRQQYKVYVEICLSQHKAMGCCLDAQRVL